MVSLTLVHPESSPCSCDLRRQEISVRWKKWHGCDGCPVVASSISHPGNQIEFVHFLCWFERLSTSQCAESACSFYNHIQVLKLIQLIHIFVQVSRWPMAEMIQNNSALVANEEILGPFGWQLVLELRHGRGLRWKNLDNGQNSEVAM